MTGNSCRNRQASVEPATQSNAAADDADQCQRERVTEHDRRHVETTEGDRRSPDADLQVVDPIDHCILGIVGNCPENVGQQQPPGFRGHLAKLGGVGHRDAKAIGMPKPKATPR